MKTAGSLFRCLKQKRGLTAACFLCVALLSLLGLGHLSLQSSSAVFLPDADEEMRLSAEMLEHSPLAGLLFVDLEAPSAALAQKAEEALQKAMPPETARSLRLGASAMTPELMMQILPSFFTPEAQEKLSEAISDEGVRRRLQEDRKTLQGLGGLAALPWVRTDPLRFREVLLERVPPEGFRSVSSDGRGRLLVFRPAGGALDADGARTMVRTLRETPLPEGVTVRFSGGPAYTAANAEAVERDIGRIALLSLAGLAALYTLMVRAWGALWIFLTPMVATLVAAAATASLWSPASALVLGFGMALMGLSEDYAIHMHFALRSAKDEASAYRNVLSPLFGGFLLNLSGFAVLLFSTIPALRQMAFFSVASLTTGFLLAVLLLPFMPAFASPRMRPSRAFSPGRGQGKRSAALLPGALLCLALLLLCTLSLSGARTDFSPRALSARGEELSLEAGRIREKWGIDSGISVLLQAPSPDEALMLAGRTAGELRQKGFERIASPSDYLLPQKEAVENAGRWRQWLSQNESLLEARIGRLAREAHFRPEAFRPFFEALPHDPELLTPDSALLGETGLRDLFSLSLFTRDDRTFALLSTGSEDPSRALSEKALILSGPLLEADVSRRFLKERSLLFFATLLALLLLVLLLRRPGRVLAAALPPLLALTAALAALRLSGLSLNLASLAALPMVFGLALDHGVMVTHALEEGLDGSTRRAVLLSSLTAFMSMGLLAFSEHPALRSMGCVIFAGLTAELAASLLLIPLVYRRIRP